MGFDAQHPGDGIDNTAELAGRAARPADHAAENRALVDLARRMVESPAAVLPAVVETALELCPADEAAIRFVDEGCNRCIVRRRAAGESRPDPVRGAAGESVRPDAPVDRPAPWALSVAAGGDPGIALRAFGAAEVLVVAIRRGETAIGDLRVVSEDPGKRFDAEDARILTDLAHLAAAAMRSLADVRSVEAGERELDDARTRLDAASEVGAIATWTWDIASDRVVADTNLAALFSLSPDEAAGAGIALYFRAIHAEDRERVAARLGEVVERGGTFAAEYRVVRPDGRVRWVEGRGKGLRDASGEVVAVAGVAVDVTDRKRTELELTDIRRRLESALAAGSVATWTWDLGSNQVRGDANLARLFSIAGGPGGEMPVDAYLERIHPDDRAANEQAIRAALAGDRYESNFRVRQPDGSIRWISSRGRVLRDDSGRPVTLQGVTVDITALKQAEDDLLESEERYRRAAAEAALAAEANAKFRYFFEQGTQFAGVLNLDGTVVEANRLCLDACGFTRDEVLGRPFWECGWWNRSAELMEMIRVSALQAAGGRLCRTETPYFVADGSLRDVDLILAPVTDQAGRVLFVAATGTDITERKRAEEELRQSDRRKDEFLAMLAHELRNPLGVISNGIQLVQTVQQPEMLAQLREMIQRQVVHLTRLIDDLLDVSRIRQGKIVLRKETVELSAIVGRTVELVRPVVEEKGHDLTVALPGQPIRFVADPTRTQQVLGNLLTNAAKYTEPGGSIRLSARVEGDAVVIRIRDTGVGISAEMLPRVFELFTQVDASLDRSQGGLGIGLTLVKNLVEMHGGSVAAASEGKGKGSEFTVRLPVGRPDEREEAPAEGPEAPRVGTGRVLVVDDNLETARLAARVLEHTGFEVETAHDGRAAVELARRFRPAVVLLDIALPGMSGYDVATALRREECGQSALLIAVSGYGEERSRERSKAAGFDHHLTKPVDFDQLMSVIGSSARA